MTVLVILLLLAPAAWGIDAPDSVWVESAEDGFVTLGFPAIEEVDGYRIYRLIAVTHVLGEGGEVVQADEDAWAWIPWAGVMIDEDAVHQDTLRVTVAILDNDDSWFGVAAFVIEDGEEILSDRVDVFVESSGSREMSMILIPTAIRRATWGQVKAER